MRVIELSNKVYLTRHWFRWYFVKRGGQEWELVGRPKNRKRTPKPEKFDIAKTAAKLQARSGQPPLPSILDEKAADAQVAKNMPKK